MIEQQLAERFQAALADEPPPGFDPDQLIDQLARRRRRLAVAGAVAVTVVSAAAAVAGVTMIGGTRGHESYQPADGQGQDVISETPTPSPPPSTPAITFGISGESPVTADPQMFELFPEETGRDHGLSVTDLYITNANGDLGTMRILRNDEVLLELALANFKNLDYHFREPMEFTREQPMVVAVSCQQAGDADGTCDADVIVAGQVVGR